MQIGTMHNFKQKKKPVFQGSAESFMKKEMFHADNLFSFFVQERSIAPFNSKTKIDFTFFTPALTISAVLFQYDIN